MLGVRREEAAIYWFGWSCSALHHRRRAREAAEWAVEGDADALAFVAPGAGAPREKRAAAWCNSSGRNGLLKQASNPAASRRARSSSAELPDSAKTIWRLASAGSPARIFFRTSTPLIPGISSSRKMTSNRCFERTRRASAPDSTATTSWPSRSTSVSFNSRIAGSSSAISIWSRAEGPGGASVLAFVLAAGVGRRRRREFGTRGWRRNQKRAPRYDKIRSQSGPIARPSCGSTDQTGFAAALFALGEKRKRFGRSNSFWQARTGVSTEFT